MMGTTGAGTGTPVSATTRYATVAAWKLWAGDNTTYFTNAEGTSLDGVIGDCLDAASRQIDRDCGRVFYKTSAATLTFKTEDTQRIPVVDLITLTEMKYDANCDDTPETALAATDYILYPLTDDEGSVPARYQELRCRTGSARWPSPGVLVSIKGDWGYVEADGAPPADIVLACIIRAGRLFARREAKLGTVSVPQMGTVGVIKGRDTDYDDLIRKFIRTDAAIGYAVT